MATLVIPNSFSPNTVIQSSQVNANFSAIATEYNAHAVQTDVAKTITVTHTFSASQTFSAGLSVGAAIIHTLAASQVIPGATSYSIRDTANANDNLLVTNAGAVTVRNGLTVTAGGLVVTGNVSSVTSTEGAVIVQSVAGNRVIWSIVGNSARGQWLQYTESSVADRWAIGSGPADTVLHFKPGTAVTADVASLSNTGALTLQGGFAVTGNSSITGNLLVTGSISAVTGANSYVRRTTDLNYTSGTDLTLTFAIGAAEEWEFEYHLVSTNASVATMSFTVAGPASCTGHFAGLGTTNNNASAIVGDAEVVFGNAMSTFNMNATACWAHIRGYVKGGGTPGNVTIAGTASAGTGVLKAGSFIRYSRIA